MTSCRSRYSFVETCVLLESFERLPRVSTKAASTDTIPDNDQANRDGKDKSRDGVNFRSDAAAEATPDLERKSIVAADKEEGDGNLIHRESEDQKACGDEREFEIRERDAPKRLPRCCAEIKRSFFLGAVHFLEACEKFGGGDGNECSAVAKKNGEQAELDAGEDGEHEQGEAGNDAGKD